jgi:DNA-binding CsgD family transcriptional regulator
VNRNEALVTVDRLYAAAFGETDWQVPLRYASDVLGCEAATLEIHDAETRELLHFDSARIDTANVARYAMEFSYNPRVAFMLGFDTGRVSFDQLFISESEIDRDPFYQELLAPAGLRYFLSAQTPLTDGRKIALVAFQLSGRTRGVDEVRLAEIRLLQPHITRALRLYWHRIRDKMDPERFDRLLAGFGLTPAERQLAVALALGEPLPAHARRTGRSMNTVYTHYRRIKVKLDCASQTELLARLHALAAPSMLS